MPGFPPRRCARAKRGARGFTLVELITVVAIVGILATIAIILVRRHFRTSKSLEAISIISAIRAAQEARRAETGSYANVSPTGLWFPATPDGSTKRSFVDLGHADGERWKQLGVSRTDGTQFGFRVFAGGPGTIEVELGTVETVSFPVADDQWYVIQAAGDIDPSSPALSLYVASSLDSELYIENEGE
jgi:prepilin-type N-terminal cleavage/methylation domain-containing protein